MTAQPDMLEPPVPGTAVATVTDAPPPAPVEPPQSLLPAIIGLARDPKMDADKLERLLALQERMEARQAEAAFNAAFVAMSQELPRIKRDGTLAYPEKNGGTRKVSNFATWEAIDDGIRAILTKHGFALSFTTERTDAALTVVAILLHSGGHSTRTPGPPLPCDASGGKNNIQGWGSALTYGKRYAATAALNLVTEQMDDDAKLAGMEFITADQVAHLQKLIAETGANERRFLDILKLQHLGEIQQGGYTIACNMLLSKKKGAA